MFVNRRAFLFSFLIFPIPLFLFPIPISANFTSDIIITEIMYDAQGTDAKHEWLELYNASNHEIDLTGWKINDGDTDTKHSLNIPPENNGQGLIKIASGEYIILASDAATFLSDHSSSSYSVIDTVLNLNNTSATLTLYDKNDNEIASLAYAKEWGANGNGKSLEKINLTPSNNQSDWQESSVNNGTPGQQNSVYLSSPEQTPDIEESQEIASSSASTQKSANHSPKAEAGPDIIALINQDILFDASKSTDSDNDSLSYFWNFGDGQTSTEIKPTHQYKFPGKYIISLNVSDGKISSSDSLIATIYSDSIIISEFLPNPEGADEKNEWIELLNISSQAADLSSWKLDTGEKSKDFSFPTNTTIGGNQHLVFSRQTTKISLNNSSGKVRLVYPTEQIAQEIKYEKATQGYSVNLIKGNEYAWSAIPTPGLSNIISNKIDKNISNLNTSIIEAYEENPVFSSLIPANSSSITNQSAQISDNKIPSSLQPSSVDNSGITQNSSDNIANKNDSKKQEQSASLIEKISSPFSLVVIIILIGFCAGIGLIWARRKIKNKIKTDKFTIIN